MDRALDVGCGDHTTVPAVFQARYQWIGLDQYDFRMVSYQDWPANFEFLRHDLKDPLPFDSESIGMVWCHHVLEHLVHRHPERDIDYVIWVVNEMHRVLKPGCEAHLIVPWIEHTNAWRAPHHYRYFNHETLKWFGFWKSMPGEHAEAGVVGHWLCTKADVVDKCHVYTILVKEA